MGSTEAILATLGLGVGGWGILVWSVQVTTCKVFAAEFGEKGVEKLLRYARERGPFHEDPSDADVLWFAALGVLFRTRPAKFLKLGNFPKVSASKALRVVFLQSLGLLCISGFCVGMCVVIDLDDQRLFSHVVYRGLNWFQSLCPESCPRSIAYRVLAVVFVGVVVYAKFFPSLRFRWIPSEGRYVRKQ